MKDTVQPHHLEFDQYSLKGVSTAGIGTCIVVPEWKVCFDVAQGLPFAFSMRHFLISHCHQDHASGIPYLISQKAMASHPPATFYLPENTADKLDQILKIWSQLEDHSYQYSLKELTPEKMELLTGNLSVASFRTQHRVSSQGYTLFSKNKRLNPKYQSLERKQLMDLKSQGEQIEETLFEPKISFTGDTQIEFLDLSPQVVDSETLIMEVTYYDQKKNAEAARKWGHTHFDEVLLRIPKIRSKNIVWIHMSARYSRHEVQKMIEQRLPNDAHRIHLL